MIFAILQAQWRSMRSFRTGMLSLPVVVSWISGLLFYGFWTSVALGAQTFFSNPANHEHFSLVLSAGLLLVLLYWQITPVITASLGASLDLKKLLVYPIPHGKLFLVELLLRVTVCLEMPIIIAGAVLGLLRNPDIGGVARSPVILGTALVYMALNILLAAAIRDLIERLLRRKRVREVLMFLLLAITVLPQFLFLRRFRTKDLGLSSLPDAPYLPWTAASHLMLGSSYAIPMLALALLLVTVYLLTRSQFEKSLRFDGSSSSIKTAAALKGPDKWEWLFRWPGHLFPDPIAAIMEKELRSLLRTPQFRFIFFTCSAFGLALYLPRMIGGERHAGSFLDGNILTFSSIYAVLLLGNVSYFNCFGFERSAAQAWFSFPVSLRTAVIAKNLATLSFILVELVFATLITLMLRLGLTAGKFAESVVVSLIAAVYMIALGNLASVRLPHALNAERVSQGGSSKTKNLVILAVFPLILLPLGLAYWARSVFSSDLIFFALLVFAALFGAILYVIGLDSAVRLGMRRREALLTELSRGEGPLSIT